ncbi:hypothetical protein DIPPA_21642 [Diplonema papillatum]|nr:hypothetical protein DIPPA_21642 [Diplonema papillatum]
MSRAVSSDEAVARALTQLYVTEEQTREDDDMRLAQVLHEKENGTTATDFNCSMCFEDFKGTRDVDKGAVTACGHKFCLGCFMQYVDTREKQMSDQIEKARNIDKVEKDIKCPLCRASIMKDANRMRKKHNKPPVHVPSHATPRPSQMTWDPATSIVVVCNKCSKRLFAPPGRQVQCTCKNLIKPQTGSSLWRPDSHLIAVSTLPPEERAATLFYCPGCRHTCTAAAGETIRCKCGTALYVQSREQRRERGRNRV